MRLNADFSDVRIHANSAKAPAVGAVAYTQGSDIHFAPGSYSPNSNSGRSLLGHELTHVVQQAQGRVQPTIAIGKRHNSRLSGGISRPKKPAKLFKALRTFRRRTSM